MIEVAGIQVPRAGMIEVAHRLVLRGETETASRVMAGLVAGDRITLSTPEREVILRTLEDAPSGLEQLREVLRGELDRAPEGLII